jgi:hypothetical protein
MTLGGLVGVISDLVACSNAHQRNPAPAPRILLGPATSRHSRARADALFSQHEMELASLITRTLKRARPLRPSAKNWKLSPRIKMDRRILW